MSAKKTAEKLILANLPWGDSQKRFLKKSTERNMSKNLERGEIHP